VGTDNAGARERVKACGIIVTGQLGVTLSLRVKRVPGPREGEREREREREREGEKGRQARRACAASEGDRGSLAARARGLWGRTVRYRSGGPSSVIWRV
jgi:hypothetical protein